GLTDLNGLGEIHKKMEWQLGEQRAYVDAIYYCPHHPHGGFEGEVPEYKIECECRKPKPGMLLQAAERFNIDLSQSFMIGDSERDAGAGRAAGVTTIGVMTGHGVKKAKTLPHYFTENLPQAVDLILGYEASAEAKKVMDHVDLEKDRTVIAIGGNSRSGKSTLATSLEKELEKMNATVLRINLDDWILPKEQREEEVDVYHNFQLPKIEADVEAILSGIQVSLQAYLPHSDRIPFEQKYVYDHQKVIILEGIVALSSEKIRAISDLKVFKNIDSDLQKSRLLAYYDWKGYSEEAFEALYTKRQKDEYEKIEKDRIFADLIL
ncbi:MAG: HAD-IIIA family hydrolase, partial [Schleiferiaceae bacterium]|nr:HAD-IIIA family hydrolase [Schleiferiaceae bacterium]